MTHQSRSNSVEDVALGSPSCSNSTESSQVYSLPLGLPSQIDICNEDQRLVSILNDLPIGPNPIIIDSNGVKIGTDFNVTVQGDAHFHTNLTGTEPPIPIPNGSCTNVPASHLQLSTEYVKKPSTGIGIVKRHFKGIVIVITTVTLICAVALITLRFVGPHGDVKVITTTTEEPTITTTRPTLIHYMFNRSSWGARSPGNQSVPLKTPVSLMVIKHTNTESCHDVSSCFSAMQDLQNSDVGEHGLSDIRYNFVIGGDGNIYEGRGWTVQNTQMNYSIDVAFLGNFSVDTPSDFMVAAGPWMIIKGVSNGYLNSATFKVVCHNQTEYTNSPGEHLYEKVVKWMFYSDEIIS